MNTSRLWDDTIEPPRWRAVTAANFTTDYAQVPMLDLACATAAAPMYFPPHNIPGFGYFADGGLSANNPALSMFAALRQAGHVKDISSIQIASFGTGLAPVGISPQGVGDPLEWGIFRWLDPAAQHGRPAMPLMAGMFDFSASSTAEIETGVFGENFVRLQPILKRAIELDETSDAAFQAMDGAIADAAQTKAYDNVARLLATWAQDS